MSLFAPIENGKVVNQTQQSTTKNTSNGMDRDTFLQLLVAQMKYQDPLQPTSNTEYISQYAQFSQVEQIQNMAGSMDLQRASQLVGKEVYVKTTAANGDEILVQGKVDSVVYENGKAYLSIDESLYPIEDLDSVVDEAYLTACEKAKYFVEKLNKLASVNNIDLQSADTIKELNDEYEAMDKYEKTFIASEKVNALKEYIAKIEELLKLAEEKEKQEGEEAEEIVENEQENIEEV